MAEAIAAEGTEASVRMLAELQSWGTPDQGVEQMTEDVRWRDGAGIIAAVGTNTLLVHRSPRQVADDEALAGS